MAFEQITGQEAAVRRLRACLRNGRVPHAFLFVGSEGTGRLTAAREVARVLLCHDTDGPDMACGECASCRALSRGNHPDYNEVALEGGRQRLSINTVRDIQHQASVKPTLGQRRVFVVQDAERFSLEAANCFLKTLEEPPDGCFLILQASSLRNLPETIISRCWLVRFSNLDPDRLSDCLRQEGAGQQQARWLARQAWGSPGRARRMREMGLAERNAGLLEALLDLRLESNFRLSERLNAVADEDASSATDARDRLQDLLECIANYYRDLALQATGAMESTLVNRDAADALAGRARRTDPEVYLDCADLVMQAIEKIGANANRRLTLDNLFTQLALREGSAP